MSNEHHTLEVSKPLPTNAYSPYILWLVWIVWLPFIVPPIVQLLQAHASALLLMTTMLCVIFFICIYVLATLQNARTLVALEPEHVHNPKWLSIALLIAFSIAIILLGMGKEYGNAWFGTLIFSSAYISGRLPTLQAFITVTLLTILTLILGLLTHLSPFEIGQSTIFVFVVGIVTMSVTRAVVTGRKLRIAQEEIAQLAVTNERLRIARDLHDLLGHNLSLITLKSELAGRLLSVAPERAANEIRDIESVARTTLQEVREAVAAYRQPTLINELHAVQEILEAANIMYHYKGDEATLASLPSVVDAVLAWTVREGVTNVVKHSHAHSCTIRLVRDAQQVGVEITDDGKTSHETAGSVGNGLRGLRERVEALHGRCEATPTNKGFRLTVFVPLSQEDKNMKHSGGIVERSERI